jgi:nitrogen regulatory protein P-II 1
MTISQQTINLIKNMKKLERHSRTSRWSDPQMHCWIGVKFLSFYEIKGMGLSMPRQEMYRGVPYGPASRTQTRDCLVPDDQVDSVINSQRRENWRNRRWKKSLSSMSRQHRIEQRYRRASALSFKKKCLYRTYAPMQNYSP